jgi:signal transduction histidine kinase
MRIIERLWVAGVCFLTPADAELSACASWLVRLRWLAIAAIMLIIALASILLPGVLPVGPLGGVVAIVGAYNFGLHRLYGRLQRPALDADALRAKFSRLLHVQITLDLLWLTFLLHFSGGIENPFQSLYILHVVIAGILLSRAAAFAFAALSVGLYGGLTFLECLGLIGHVGLRGYVDPALYQRLGFVILANIAFSAGVLLAALLTSSIAARLREREADLCRCAADFRARSEELAAANRQLSELEEMRKRFTVLVTHDLRAPIAAIQGYLRLILTGLVPAERQLEVISCAERRAAELLDRTRDLLVLTQIREKLTHTELVDLAKVLDEVLDILQGAIVARRLSLQVSVAEDTPCLMVNREHIRQVWMNLVSNAIKYTPPDGRIEIQLTHTPASVIGVVRDTGIGIAPEDQVAIFQGFARASAAKRMAQYGTGLGLAIVKQIVEGYGGTIEVASAPGQGATFTFTLPRGDGGSLPAPAASAP